MALDIVLKKAGLSIVIVRCRLGYAVLDNQCYHRRPAGRSEQATSGRHQIFDASIKFEDWKKPG